MDVVVWAPVASAAVSIISAAAAGVAWFRARGEREEAARQAGEARRAAVRSAEHLAVIAAVQVEQHKAASLQGADEEIEPWVVDDDTRRGGMILRNRTGRSKYNIRLAGETVTNRDHFEFIGPYGEKPFNAFRIGNGPVDVEITWHLREDRSDEPLTQRWVLG